MVQQNKTVYSSLEELRSEKLKVVRKLQQQKKALKKDAVDMFLPSNNIFFTSDYSYMRYIGYVITAYKTFTTFRKISNFFRRRR